MRSCLRIVNRDCDIHCTLVVAKASVANTKIVTILRLKLSEALLSAEVGTAIKSEFKVTVSEEFFRTDSRVVLACIINEARRFHTFVAKRIQKIRQL